jgi:hypothetical protein
MGGFLNRVRQLPAPAPPPPKITPPSLPGAGLAASRPQTFVGTNNWYDDQEDPELARYLFLTTKATGPLGPEAQAFIADYERRRPRSLGTWGQATQQPDIPWAEPPPEEPPMAQWVPELPFIPPPSLPPVESIEEKVARANPPAQQEGTARMPPPPKPGQYEDEVGPQQQEYYQYQANADVPNMGIATARFGLKNPITGNYRESAFWRPENYSSLTPNSPINGVSNTVKFAEPRGKENPFIDKVSDPPRTRPLEMTKEIAKVQLAKAGLDPNIMDIVVLEYGDLFEGSLERGVLPVPPGNVGRLGGEGGYYLGDGSGLLTGRGQLSLRPEDYGQQSQVAIHEAVGHLLEDNLSPVEKRQLAELKYKYPMVTYNNTFPADVNEQWHTITGWLDEFNSDGVPLPQEVREFLNVIIQRILGAKGFAPK